MLLDVHRLATAALDGLIVVIMVGMIGCGHGAKRAPQFPDAPVQLGDDGDREQAIDALWAMPLGAVHDAARARIAEALLRRIATALAEAQPRVAEGLTLQLTSLWQADPETLGRALTPHLATLRSLRATFARSGALEPTLCTLVLLAEVEPTRRAAYLAELDEILAFAREATAADSELPHASPAALLQPTVLALPVRWLVDRYVALLEAQQQTIAAQFATRKSFDLVASASEVLQTARRIASALARSHRVGEIAAHVAALAGLGEDRALRTRAEAVTRQPSADAYLELARILRAEDHQAPDHAAALAVALAGDAAYPREPRLLTVAAESAASLRRVEQSIALFEAALAAEAGTPDPATALHLARAYGERIARLAFGGRPAAAATAWREVTTYTGARATAPIWGQVEAVAETALGRGLLSQGRVRDAEDALTASLERAPSIDAYETLTTIFYKTDRLSAASGSATRGLAALGDSFADRYRRAKLERLSADVMRAAGKSREANALYLDALRIWTTLGDDKTLPRHLAAERKLEFARGMWFLGNAERAVDLVLEAIDTAPEAASICSEAVAFLLEVDKPTDALDAMHRGLSSSGLGELDKVYMSLWVLGDERRRGEDQDRQALAYLETRQGELWYDQLAQAATGRRDLATLRAGATTSPRRAELAFYTTTLGLDPATSAPAARRRAFEGVVAAGIVMDAEYDLARLYLTHP